MESKMKVTLLNTPQIDIALFGLGKNKGITTGMSFKEFTSVENGQLHPKYRQMLEVANKLCDKPEGHRKFLRQIFIAIEVTAPRYWWSEFDTYKIGTTAQSESTMHTILKKELNVNHFECDDNIPDLNRLINTICEIEQIKNDENINSVDKTIEIKKILPESFLQCRVVTLNYEVFKNIYRQRKNHRLLEWREFCKSLLSQLVFWHWITDDLMIERL